MATLPDKRTCPLLTVRQRDQTSEQMRERQPTMQGKTPTASKDVIVALHCNPHSDSQYNCSPTLRLLSHVVIMCTILVMM